MRAILKYASMENIPVSSIDQTKADQIVAELRAMGLPAVRNRNNKILLHKSEAIEWKRTQCATHKSDSTSFVDMKAMGALAKRS